MKLSEITAGIRRAGTAALDQDATSIPMAAYHSPEVFELEVERLFRPGWLLIGRVDDVPTPGSYFAIDVVGEPLLITRDAVGEIHVFSRLCPHRGMAVAEGAGEANLLRCPYHSWAFDLAGQCVRAPFMEDTEGFDPAAQHLLPVHFEVWLGFVFVNLDGKAAPLAPTIVPLEEKLRAAGFADMVFVDTYDFGEQPIDWKILLENSIECYHHCGTHARSLQANFPAEMSYCDADFPEFAVTYSVAKNTAEALEDGTVARRQLDSSTANIVTIYPIAHFAYRINLATVLQIFPIAAGRSRIVMRMMVPRAAAEAPDAAQLVEANRKRMLGVFHEDFEMCARLQQLTTATLARPGRLSSNLEKPVWHFYRYLAEHLTA